MRNDDYDVSKTSIEDLAMDEDVENTIDPKRRDVSYVVVDIKS